MKALFDTSVLIAGLVEGHPHHEHAWPWMERAVDGRLEAAMSTHSLAELYAVLSVHPSLKPRPAPHEIVELLARSVLPHVRAISLDPTDYEETLRRCADRGVRGSGLHDALIEQERLHAAGRRPLGPGRGPTGRGAESLTRGRRSRLSAPATGPGQSPERSIEHSSQSGTTPRQSAGRYTETAPIAAARSLP